MLKQELLESLKKYMQSKETIKKNAIQNVRAQVLKFEKDNNIEAQDDKILDIISKEIKALKNSIPEFEKGNRQDLVDEANVQIETLSIFIPEQLSQVELEKILTEIKDENGFSSMKDMGQMMKIAKEKIGMKSDGKTISDMVKKVLS